MIQSSVMNIFNIMVSSEFTPQCSVELAALVDRFVVILKTDYDVLWFRVISD